FNRLRDSANAKEVHAHKEADHYRDRCHAEPESLVPHWRYRECNRSAVLIPNSAGITSLHTKFIVAGWKIRVEGFAPLPSILPIGVVLVQFVSKCDLLSINESKSGVVDFKIMGLGWKSRGRGKFCFTMIGSKTFNFYGRHDIVHRQVSRINPLNTN